MPDAYPGLATTAAEHRIEEATDVGADALVTACHHCRINLSGAQAHSNGERMPIIDIIDLVYEAADL